MAKNQDNLIIKIFILILKILTQNFIFLTQILFYKIISNTKKIFYFIKKLLRLCVTQIILTELC